MVVAIRDEAEEMWLVVVHSFESPTPVPRC